MSNRVWRTALSTALAIGALGLSVAVSAPAGAASSAAKSASATVAEPATTAPWKVEKTPNRLGPAPTVLTADSCVGSTCEAVGYSYATEDPTASQVILAEMWNGSTWTSQPVPVPSGAMLSILYGVSCTTGDACIAVGYWENASFVPFTLAEAWNGTNWTIQTTPNPSGAETLTLNAVSCSGSTCAAVGSYDTGAGDVMLAEVWSGTAWTIQTTPGPATSTETSLAGVSCTSPTTCTAVGNWFNDSVGDVPLGEVWSGGTWSADSLPNPSGSIEVDLNGVSCTAATTCTAVGYWLSSSYAFQPLAETLSGTTWTQQTPDNPTGGSSKLYGVSCSATSCLVNGYYTGDDTQLPLSETWNGSAWNVLGTPYPSGSTASELNGVSCPTSGTACTAVGYFTSASGADLASAELLTGTTWTIQSAPNATGSLPTLSVLSAVSCPETTACTAVGYDDDTAGSEVTLAEAWNGMAWKIQPTVNPANAVAPGSVLDGVSCTAAAACTAVGYYWVGSASARLLVEAWNGAHWKVQTVPLPAGTSDSYLNGVSCNSTGCTAVGGYFDGTNESLVESWNGTTWKVEKTPTPAHGSDAALVGVSCPLADACTAVGYYQYSLNAANAQLTLAESWNGTSWTIQPTPGPAGKTDNNESDLEGVSCQSSTVCTAVGYDWNNTSQAYVMIAEAWNGTSWVVQNTPNANTHSGSEGASAPVDGVSCTSQDACTAAGSYDDDGSAALIEAWNGTAWKVQKSPSLGDSALYGVASTSSGSTAVGYVYDNGTPVTLAEKSS